MRPLKIKGEKSKIMREKKHDAFKSMSDFLFGICVAITGAIVVIIGLTGMDIV